jgi:hypothetical protein
MRIADFSAIVELILIPEQAAPLVGGKLLHVILV